MQRGPSKQMDQTANTLPARSGLHSNPPPGAAVLQPIVEERVREVVKERVENRYIEVPQIYFVEKFVEVPQEVPEEKIVTVVKPVKKEVIKYVKKPVFVDKVVEVPEIKYVDKVVEVPRYAVKEKIIEVPKVLVIERIIPVLKSYRKEQIVTVDPGSQATYGGSNPTQYAFVSCPSRAKLMDSRSRDAMFDQLFKPSSDSPLMTPSSGGQQPFGLCQTPMHPTLNRQMSQGDNTAVQKSASAPAVARVVSGSEGEAEPSRFNVMSSFT